MKSVLLTPFHLHMQHEIQCIPLWVHLAWQTWSPPPSCPAPHPTSVLKPTDVTGAVPALGTSDLVVPGQVTPLQPYLILNSIPKSCPKCHFFTEVSVTVTLPHFHSLLERTGIPGLLSLCLLVRVPQDVCLFPGNGKQWQI